MNQKKAFLFLVLAILISLFMHAPHFGKDIMSFHSWRQTQTQATINNFYEEDMNITHPRRLARGNGDGIKRMEFPLMQWLIAASYHVFGPSVLLSRIIVYGLSILSILGIYFLLLVLFKNQILAVMGAWAFTFSPTFYYYSINPQPDNMALTAGIWGLALFFSWLNQKKSHLLWLSALFLAISTLCKLPFIAFYMAPFVYFLKQLKLENEAVIIKQGAVFLLFSLFPITWYTWVIPTWDANPIIWGMLEQREALSRLLYYFQFNLISNLPELLLNYGSVLFFLSGFYFFKKIKAFKDKRFPLILGVSLTVLAYYLFEANAIAKVHDYYLFPFLPLLFILVGYGAYNLYVSKQKAWRYFTLFALAILPLTCYLRMKDRWNPESPGFNPDLLKYKSELRAAVPDDALVVTGNDISSCIFLYYIDKKGWSFTDGHLSGEELKQLSLDGAEYLYIDSEAFIQREDIKKRLAEKVGQFGSVYIYKLKKD